MMSANPFGFSTETSSGDFLPICKYDARAGRIFRVDRMDVGGQFSNEPVDITQSFKALFDLENGETGWISFAGPRPDFRLVPIGTPLPPQPPGVDEKGKPLYSNGLRFMLKLTKDCGGDKPVREIAGTARVFTNGMQNLYLQYLAEKDANPGKLPIVTLEKAIPVSTGTGDRKSTNYQPVFKITGWAPRGDLVFQPKGGAAPSPSAASATPPSTGSTRVEPPAAKQPEMAETDDFG
jgi:hypothetical protein